MRRMTFLCATTALYIAVSSALAAETQMVFRSGDELHTACNLAMRTYRVAYVTGAVDALNDTSDVIGRACLPARRLSSSWTSYESTSMTARNGGST
jgi:hypothetical protein